MPPEASDAAVPHGSPASAGVTFVSAAAARGGPIADPAAATRVLDGVADALARWFGPFGYHALVTRALAHARAAHPALAAARVRAPLTPVLDGLAEATQAHGSAATTAGVVAVIAGVVDLVGSVIGDDMALQLLEQYMELPSPAASGPAPDHPATNGMSTGGGSTNGARTGGVRTDSAREAAP